MNYKNGEALRAKCKIAIAEEEDFRNFKQIYGDTRNYDIFIKYANGSTLGELSDDYYIDTARVVVIINDMLKRLGESTYLVTSKMNFLSVRVRNIFIRKGITNIDEAYSFVSKYEDWYNRLRGMGNSSITEVYGWLVSNGYELGAVKAVKKDSDLRHRIESNKEGYNKFRSLYQDTIQLKVFDDYFINNRDLLEIAKSHKLDKGVVSRYILQMRALVLKWCRLSTSFKTSNLLNKSTKNKLIMLQVDNDETLFNMLCSDGLEEELTDKEINDIVSYLDYRGFIFSDSIDRGGWV